MQHVPTVQIFGMCVVFVWRHVYDVLENMNTNKTSVSLSTIILTPRNVSLICFLFLFVLAFLAVSPLG